MVGSPLSMGGRFVPNLERLNLRPAVSVAVAIAAVRADVVKRDPGVSDAMVKTSNADLDVFVGATGAPALAYHVRVDVVDGKKGLEADRIVLL